MASVVEAEPVFSRHVVPIYRPVVQCWEREPDGNWREDFGPHTLTTWSPMPSEDVVIEYPAPGRDLRRVVYGGDEPKVWVVIPAGEFFERRGETCLRTPGERELAPVAVYLRALKQTGEFAIHRPEPPAIRAAPPVVGPVAEPVADLVVDRLAGPPGEFAPARGPVAQLGFGWCDPPAARTRARRKGRELAGDAPGWKGAASA